ncbi:MAG: hypothetical protein ABSA06_02945 [Geobacteraceae bacterium]|jgi:hypothetical protein
MLNSKTVFILGAGASYEVGFPLGSKLKEIISSKLDLEVDYNGNLIRGEGSIYKQLKYKYPGNLGDINNVCRKISKGIVWSDSIDDFINQHNHDERIAICGKLAIASSILEAEKESKLYFESKHIDDSIDYNSLKDTWYAQFYSLLNKGSEKTDLNNIFNNITVINFNYDRSLEHFLTHVFIKNHLLNKEEARNIINNLVIFRPYGSIDQSVEFGSKELPKLDDILSNIKTYTEQIDDVKGLKQVQSAIQDSEAIVFLGMAYHPNNMFLLQCECDMKTKIVFATRNDISDNDLPVIIKRIITLGSSQDYHIDSILNDEVFYNKTKLSRKYDNIYFANKCIDLFKEYRYSLSEL